MNSESVSLSQVKASVTTWPTRYTLVACMLLTFIIAWADRIAFSVATPKIMGTFGWSKTQMGFVLSAFTWGFVVFKLPAGWLADRYGGMKTMIGAVLFWSFVTILFPFSTGLAVMAGLRLLLGMGEVAYPPSQIRILSRWFPDKERPKVNGICLAAGGVGTILATPLAAWLLVMYDWRRVFYLFGAMGIVWGLGFWRWSSRPQTVSRLNEQVSTSGTAHEKKGKFPWTRLLRIRAVWGLIVVYFSVTYCFWVFFNWLPTYLVEERGFTLLKMGYYATLPYAGQSVTQIAFGWLCAYLITRGFSKNFSRKVIIGGCFLGASTFLILCVNTASPILAVVYISASISLLGASYTPIWTIPTDLSTQWPGTIFGLAGTIGFLGGALAPIITGYIVDTTGSWNLSFYLASAVSLVGLLATVLLVSTDSIDARLNREVQ